MVSGTRDALRVYTLYVYICCSWLSLYLPLRADRNLLRLGIRLLVRVRTSLPFAVFQTGLKSWNFVLVYVRLFLTIMMALVFETIIWREALRLILIIERSKFNLFPSNYTISTSN